MNDNNDSNKQKFREQDELDDLLILRAMQGLSPEQFIALNKLSDETGCIEGEEFTSIDRCVAVVDVWIAESDDENSVQLTRSQKERLFRQFIGHQERDELASDLKQNGSRRWSSWRLAWVSSAAAVLLAFLGSIAFTAPKDEATESAKEINQMHLTIDAMRQAMLENPPADMLRWVWTDRLTGEQAIEGDVIWSDLLQKGYAWLNGLPKHSLNSYELHAFNTDASNDSVFCGEFHFDPITNSILMKLSPENRIERPSRFSVLRKLGDSTREVNSEQAIATWVAEAPDAPFPSETSITEAQPVPIVPAESVSPVQDVTAMQ